MDIRPTVVVLHEAHSAAVADARYWRTLTAELDERSRSSVLMHSDRCGTYSREVFGSDDVLVQRRADTTLSIRLAMHIAL